MRYREYAGLSGGEVYELTSSLDHDAVMAPFIAKTVKAHIDELLRLGLIGEAEADAMKDIVDRVSCEPPSSGFEDLWEALEDAMVRGVGRAAEWYGLGRSRNDQVAAALRLYTAFSLAGLAEVLAKAALRLLERGDWTPMPGYTHGEKAFIHSWICLVSAYSESLLDSALTLIWAARLALSRSPLGAAAGAGSLAPIDEEGLASRLGFESVYHSPYYAVASRAFLEAASAALSVACVEMSRIAEDLAALHRERLVDLPEGHVATSSFIPGKRNPVTLEKARAAASECLAKAQAPLAIALKQRYSYNLDMQEANRAYTEALRAAASAATILGEVLALVEVNRSAAVRDASEGPFSAEEAERISLEEGVPFRRAYAEVARRGARRWEPGEVLSSRRTGCSKARMPGAVEKLRSALARAAAEAGEIARRASEGAPCVSRSWLF